MNSVLPSHAMRSQPIRQVATHSAELKSFLFEQTFDAEPGQFVMLWIPGLDEKPFSVSDVWDGKIEITAKAVGPFSRALMDCKPGDRLGLRGPFGRGFRPRGRGLVVAGGWASRRCATWCTGSRATARRSGWRWVRARRPK